MVENFPVGGAKLKGAFSYLENLGLVDFLLPFALIFVLFFAVLQKVMLFKTKDKDGKEVGDRRINGVLALAISLLVALPHVVGMYPPNRDPIVLISKFLPQAGVLLGAVLALLLLLGLAGANTSGPLVLLVGVISAGLLAIVFLMNVFPEFIGGFEFLQDPATQALLIVLLTMGLIGWFVMRPEKKSKKLSETLEDWVYTKRPK